jgi:glycosyltransferase involved in cell wall biosynthesis
LHLFPSQTPLAPWLKTLDVFVSSSRWEGSPLVVLEAMALGRAVVATRQGAGELLEDGREALLVDSQDPGALAQAILRLLKDRSEAARLSKAAFKAVQTRFSLRQYALDLMALYDEICLEASALRGAQGPKSDGQKK